MSQPNRKLYVKVAASAARELMARPVEAAGATYDWEEVFAHDFSLAAAEADGGPAWLALVPRGEAPAGGRWDVAHRVRQEGLAAACAAGAVEMVEPEAEAEARPEDFPVRLEAPENDCTPAGQDDFWPMRPEFGWHLYDGWSQLKRARENVDFGAGTRVRIGHIDTGYDPHHVTRPRRLRADLGWNFESNTSDTVDRYPYSPALPPYTFGGHGPSTLSVLAGARVTNSVFDDDLGGAPEAEVVPIVATGSVIIGDTAAWARSVEWAVHRDCHVISMSAGGIIPSQLLWDATLRAAERGVVVCAAAGNRFGCFPGIDRVTLPALYPHVLAVTGALANHTPYHTCSLLRYSACKWKDADTQLAAYTTNVAKARRGCAMTVDRNGDGTSHATPQVAAAAAIYIQKWQARLPGGWARVRAVHRALFASAARVHLDFYTQGILRANDALAIAPAARAAEEAPARTFTFPLFESLPGFAALDRAARPMLVAEAHELAGRSEAVARVADPWSQATAAQRQQALVTALLADGATSAALRAFLEDASRSLGPRVTVSPVSLPADEPVPAGSAIG